MPPDKHISIKTQAWLLHCFVPRCTFLQLQSLHHGSIKANLCSPLCPILFSTSKDLRCSHYGFSARMGEYSASRGASYTFFYCIRTIRINTTKIWLMLQSQSHHMQTHQHSVGRATNSAQSCDNGWYRRHNSRSITTILCSGCYPTCSK